MHSDEGVTLRGAYKNAGQTPNVHQIQLKDITFRDDNLQLLSCLEFNFAYFKYSGQHYQQIKIDNRRTNTDRGTLEIVLVVDFVKIKKIEEKKYQQFSNCNRRENQKAYPKFYLSRRHKGIYFLNGQSSADSCVSQRNPILQLTQIEKEPF